MTEHEQAVEKCILMLKKLREDGFIINAVTWFDETHFHINCLTKEEVEAREKFTADFISGVLNKDSKSLKETNACTFLSAAVIDTKYIPQMKEIDDELERALENSWLANSEILCVFPEHKKDDK